MFFYEKFLLALRICFFLKKPSGANNAGSPEKRNRKKGNSICPESPFFKQIAAKKQKLAETCQYMTDHFYYHDR